ncbi:Alpha-2-macroglobulin [Amphibalanus amphitrite]|uniref:Alpha-2-macroglobulin n=1 Tax=Amphibalanus amphitrite TaxID=1232801 RepID=A0A6A4VQN9_AMPAM|nr:Alpha-2-macroglobulin [Amphibalanus amphitrite]
MMTLKTFRDAAKFHPKDGVRTVADLEMTSYITQSLIELSGMENMRTARLAVKWIIEQRSQMFFDSPQAAAASLQALAAFSRRTHSSKSKSTVSVTIGDSKPYYLHVDPTNRLLQQTFRVKDVKFPTRARFEVTEGCVTLKTALHYASISKNPHPAFVLNTTATERPSSKPGSTFTVTTCVAMNPTFPPVDLASLIVDMPSGYVPVSASVRELRHSHQIKGLKIMNNDAVEVRLEDITQKTKCFSFRIVRETVVEEPKWAIVNVIDYFSLSRRAETTYTLQ